MTPQRDDEQALAEMVGRLHDVALNLHDCDGRQAAVDYVFDGPDGEGAVEVTTVRDPDAAAWSPILHAPGPTLTSRSSIGWLLRLSDSQTKQRVLQQRVPDVIALCESLGVDRVADLPPDARTTDADWLIDHGVDLMADHSTLSRPGEVRIQQPPVSRAVTFDAEVLDHQVATFLAEERISRKLVKLAAHPGATERHLVVYVDLYGTGHELLDTLLLTSPGVTPTYQPPADFPATHVWLTGNSYSVLTWDHATGWAWRQNVTGT
ncbi:hypothetical protein [Tsukamurella soli]|uniref:hypothetical protein n=1 Tax=Tsukamurella soli TaxID=644556 RepID=UPI0031E8B7F5